VGGPKMVHACCWAHARRKFFEAAKLNPSDVAATRMVAQIDDLFGVDAQARELNLDYAARHALRLERAQPLVEIIRGEVEAARDACLPSSALGKAANYTLSLWGKLIRFLEYPELELSNNLAENSMRPVALGRNYVQPQVMYSRPRCGRAGRGVEACRLHIIKETPGISKFDHRAGSGTV
jgi:transposase